MNIPAERLALSMAAIPLLLAAEPAFATLTSQNIFTSRNPLEVFVNFMTGPFAYGLLIVGVVATGATLIFGTDFSGFSRRMPLVAGAGGILILADELVQVLFGAAGGFSVPPDMLLQAWPWPDGAEAAP